MPIFMGKLIDKNENRIPMLYMISGSVIKTVNSTAATMHSWNEIQTMFKNKYEFTPTDVNLLGVSYLNGDGAATGIHIEGATYQSNTFHAVFNSSYSGNIRVNYAYFYYY